MSMWTLLMWMSNVSLHILLCCPHKVMLTVRGTHDGWIQHSQILSEKYHKTVKTVPPRPRLFSLPGQLKVTRYFLPKLHYYRTFYYFKVLNSKEFLTWQSIWSRCLALQASDKNCPAATMSHLPCSGQTLDSGLKFIKKINNVTWFLVENKGDTIEATWSQNISKKW